MRVSAGLAIADISGRKSARLVPGSAAYVHVSSEKKSQRPPRRLARIFNADAVTDGDVLLGNLNVARCEPQRVAVQRLAIERFVDRQRRTEFSRTVHQIAIAFRL